MGKTNPKPTTAAASDEWVLPADELAATIERLRTIAAEAGDHLLLGDGPPHPDHKLLDLCAEALHWRRRSDVAEKEFRKRQEVARTACEAQRRHITDTERGANMVAYLDWQGHEKSMKRILFEAKRIRAQSAAGIYAKALIVRSTQTGATLMAMSLADDLIACPGLRESLWPGKAEGV
jgi:hypothetical protein